jgi:cytochrome c556
MRAALLALATCVIAATAVAQDPIEARKANRSAIRDDFRWINQQQASGDLNAIAQRAGAIIARSPAFLTYFPAGSDRGNTGTLPTVFSDWATFQQREADMVARMTELQTAAQAGNRAGVQAAVRTAGATCQSCHDRFRRPTS